MGSISRLVGIAGAMIGALLVASCDEGSKPLPISPNPPEPAGPCSLCVSINYAGTRGVVDAKHPVRIHLYRLDTGPLDSRSYPLAERSIHKNPGSYVFTLLDEGFYDVVCYFDFAGDGVQQPSPSACYSTTVSEDSCTSCALRILDSIPRMPLFGRSTTPGTPLPHREAEEMALWLADSLVAPRDLYELLDGQTSSIRCRFKEAVPEIRGIYFQAPWQAGTLVLGLDQDARQRIREGRYDDLDSLNAVFGAADLDTAAFPVLSIARLTTYGRLHPRHLAAAYARVSSVVSAAVVSFVGTSPPQILDNLIPWRTGTGMGYLFCRIPHPECLSDPPARYWYFECSNDSCSYRGDWVPAEQAPPVWWPEIEAAVLAFWSS
jgi:hypothetical protein